LLRAVSRETAATATTATTTISRYGDRLELLEVGVETAVVVLDVVGVVDVALDVVELCVVVEEVDGVEEVEVV